MKKSTSLFLACLVLLGTSACSTAQKQEDQTADITSSGEEVAQEESTDAFTEPSAAPEESTAVAALEPAPMEEVPMAAPEQPVEQPKKSRSSSTSDYSLGAGSSGRGH